MRQTLNIPASGNSSSTSGSFTLKFQRGLPMSGSEQPEYSAVFNNDASFTNCYTYALTCVRNPVNGERFLLGGLAPGELGWGVEGIDYTDMDTAISSAIEAVRVDCNAWGGNGTTDFYEVDADTMVPSGYYKVALGIDLVEGDYHWYRQISDGAGLWAHKMGSSDVETTDDSGDDIYDPAAASVGTYKFAGYFALKPPNDELVPPTSIGSEIHQDSSVIKGAGESSEE